MDELYDFLALAGVHFRMSRMIGLPLPLNSVATLSGGAVAAGPSGSMPTSGLSWSGPTRPQPITREMESLRPIRHEA